MSSKQNSKTLSGKRSIVLFLGLAVIISGLVGGYILERQSGSTSGQSIRLPLKAEKAFARTMEEYMCPCGSCTLVLAECTCGGAVEVKRDTRQRLAKEDSVSADDVAWILENIHQASPTG